MVQKLASNTRVVCRSRVYDVCNANGCYELFENRFKSIINISQQFLSMLPTFEIGMTKELKIYGCGQFTVDSFYIFARPSSSAASSAIFVLVFAKLKAIR